MEFLRTIGNPLSNIMSPVFTVTPCKFVHIPVFIDIDLLIIDFKFWPRSSNLRGRIRFNYMNSGPKVAFILLDQKGEKARLFSVEFEGRIYIFLFYLKKEINGGHFIWRDNNSTCSAP